MKNVNNSGPTYDFNMNQYNFFKILTNCLFCKHKTVFNPFQSNELFLALNYYNLKK
jgi:hypothetical protein